MQRFSKDSCSSAGKTCHWQLCGGIRGRRLRVRSVRLSLDTGPSSWCGIQVAVADSNLQLRPSEVRGGRKIHTGNTHTHTGKYELENTHSKSCGLSNVTSCRKQKSCRSFKPNPVWIMTVYWSDSLRSIKASLDGKYWLSYRWVGIK